jgi:mono/diheme cytochrome c family protein
MKQLVGGQWSVVKGVTLLRLLLLLLLASGCDLLGRPTGTEFPTPEDKATDFGVLYATRCCGCHGTDGKLGPAPPLNDPIFLAIVPDAELLRVIAEGRTVIPGQKSLMPAFARNHGGPLTDVQVEVLADGIKKHWQPSSSQSGSFPSYTEPAAGGKGNKDNGARVFTGACAGCHGPHGEGEKDGQQSPGGAINNQAFLALISNQALRRIIITGRPDLGMPAYDGKMGRPQDYRTLTSAEIDDLVALLKYWRGANREARSQKSEVRSRTSEVNGRVSDF